MEPKLKCPHLAIMFQKRLKIANTKDQKFSFCEDKGKYPMLTKCVLMDEGCKSPGRPEVHV